MLVRQACLVLVSLSALVLSACLPVEPIGDEVGQFTLVGELDENLCGQEAVPVFPMLSFDVAVRRQDTVGYWDRNDAPMVTGSIEVGDPEAFEFFFRSEVRSRHPNAPEGTPDCILAQDERIQFELTPIEEEGESDDPTPAMDPVPAPESEEGDEEDPTRYELVGTQTIEWTPASLRTCGYLVWSEGGPFNQLPCTVRYSLSGQSL